MLEIRVYIPLEASLMLAKALIITTRYAAVRRQFPTLKDSKAERKLIDYQTHMFKLAPLIAYNYVMIVVARY